MIKSRLTRRKVASRNYAPTTRKFDTKDYQYNKGTDSNTTNDDSDSDKWRYATDVREMQVGKWNTRRGAEFFSTPVGEITNVQQTTITGAGTLIFNSSTFFAHKVVATTSGRLTGLKANLLNPGTATGTVVLALHTDLTGSPGLELVRTSIANSAITVTAQYLTARSITCPEVVAGVTYWIVGSVQDGGSNTIVGGYQISTTTAGATGKTSTSGGQSWIASNVEYNVALITATAGAVKGHIRVKRQNNTNFSCFAHGTNLYSVNEATGAVTSIDNAISNVSTRVRLTYVNDVLYYTDGTQKPRKYDFTVSSSVSTAPDTAYNLITHKGLVFYMSAVDTNKMYYTNFGLYDTFTSTDFIYVDAPKTGDPMTAFAKLNGNLYVMTRNNKFILYGSENATFRLDNAIGQKGTFSQESIAYDEDKIYLANDEGIFVFNGAEEINIAADVLDWWKELSSKQNTVLDLHNSRLYIFYTPAGKAENSRCRVYNTLYGIWESDDTSTLVSTVYSRLDNDDVQLIGSNRVGMLMVNEAPTNDYNNMGEPFTYELRTKYEHYNTPAQYKRASYFRPHFDAVKGIYGIQIGYAIDFSDSPTYFNLNLQPSGVRFNDGSRFDQGARFGGLSQINPTDSGPVIPGQWRRLQIRYKHYGAREPVSFDGHILSIQAQRIT